MRKLKLTESSIQKQPGHSISEFEMQLVHDWNLMHDHLRAIKVQMKIASERSGTCHGICVRLEQELEALIGAKHQ